MQTFLSHQPTRMGLVWSFQYFHFNEHLLFDFLWKDWYYSWYCSFWLVISLLFSMWRMSCILYSWCIYYFTSALHLCLTRGYVQCKHHWSCFTRHIWQYMFLLILTSSNSSWQLRSGIIISSIKLYMGYARTWTDTFFKYRNELYLQKSCYSMSMWQTLPYTWLAESVEEK